MKKILLIGCGHMGQALLASWINSNNYNLTIIDPKQYNNLKKKYKNTNLKVIKSISNLGKLINFDYIVFAIRPVDLKNVLTELSVLKFKKNTSIISIIAGKELKIFKNKIKNIQNFFRVMPNMPALIGESMNCIVSNKNVTTSKKFEIIKLFSHSGKTIFLTNENQIDMSTAISGSGPGFVFNIIDAMEKAAIDLGFKKNIAKTLVLETFRGSINLLIKSNDSAENLVNKVATKGGTTEAGLNIMKVNKLHKIFKDLTKASYKKAKNQAKK